MTKLLRFSDFLSQISEFRYDEELGKVIDGVTFSQVSEDLFNCVILIMSFRVGLCPVSTLCCCQEGWIPRSSLLGTSMAFSPIDEAVSKSDFIRVLFKLVCSTSSCSTRLQILVYFCE